MEVEKVFVDKGLICIHVYFGNFETLQGPQLVDAIVGYLTEDLTLLQVPNATGDLFQKNLAQVINQLDVCDVASLISHYETEDKYTLSVSNPSLPGLTPVDNKPSFRLKWFAEKMGKLLGEEHQLVQQLLKMCKGVKRSRIEDRPKQTVLLDLDEGLHRQQVASEAEYLLDQVLFSPGTRRLPDYG